MKEWEVGFYEEVWKIEYGSWGRGVMEDRREGVSKMVEIWNIKE